MSYNRTILWSISWAMGILILRLHYAVVLHSESLGHRTWILFSDMCSVTLGHFSVSLGQCSVFCVSWIVFSDMCSVSLGQCSVFCVSWTAWESRDPLRLYYTSTTAKTTPITFHYAWHCRPHAWLSFTFENHKSTISIDRSLDWMKFVRICDTVWSNRTGIK